MASELRKTILEIEDIEWEPVTVPQWGVTLVVKGLTARERAKFLKTASVTGEVDLERFMPDLVIASTFEPEHGEDGAIIGPSSVKVFEPADRDALNGKSAAAVQILVDEALRLSGLSTPSVEEAKADFGETPSDDSPSS